VKGEGVEWSPGSPRAAGRTICQAEPRAQQLREESALGTHFSEYRAQNLSGLPEQQAEGKVAFSP
jgi:hypothetical protein